jgi:nicotinate-nucleotide adenylyltransferase
MNSVKTGLFFGSFNPIHIGHLMLANYMLEFTDLECVWFVVSPHNPLKKKAALLDERQRLYMVELAIGDNDKLKASDIEFKLTQPSYTINTLTHLHEKYPKREFALIMGSDNLQSFHKWKNYEEILKNHHIYVYPRPNYDGGELIKHPHVILTQAPVIEISSTKIRSAIKEKKNMQYFVPAAVWQYVTEMNFYKK